MHIIFLYCSTSCGGLCPLYWSTDINKFRKKSQICKKKIKYTRPHGGNVRTPTHNKHLVILKAPHSLTDTFFYSARVSQITQLFMCTISPSPSLYPPPPPLPLPFLSFSPLPSSSFPPLLSIFPSPSLPFPLPLYLEWSRWLHNYGPVWWPETLVPTREALHDLAVFISEPRVPVTHPWGLMLQFTLARWGFVEATVAGHFLRLKGRSECLSCATDGWRMHVQRWFEETLLS